MADLVETARRAIGSKRAARLAEDWALPLAVGGLLSWTQAPASAWPILFLALPAAGALFLRALGAARPRRAAARLGWLLGFGYFFPGLLWIGSAFLVDADTFGWMRPIAVTGLPAGLALFWAAAFWLAAWLATSARRTAARRAARRGEEAEAHTGRIEDAAAAAAACLGLALIWSAAEFVRGHALTGFPWGLVAYGWVDTAVAQAAALVGPYGLSTATLAAGAGFGPLALFAARRLKARLLRGPEGGATPTFAAVAGVMAALTATPLALLAGWGLARPPAPIAAANAPLIRLVQPNVPQKEKWAPAFRQRNLERLIALSAAPAQADLAWVVWPEMATPYQVDREPELRRRFVSAAQGAALILGGLRLETDMGGRRHVYNSLLVVTPLGRVSAIYDKHHLVPFGEYLPFQDVLESWGVLQLAGGRGGFSAGPGPRRLATPSGPSFAPMICYEAIFPAASPPISSRPDMILQITNDAWFGESGGPHQHLAQARFRAIEQGLPFFRSANTGVTAAIDAHGGLLETLALGEMGVIDVRLPPVATPTVYARSGEWASLTLWGVLAAAFVGLARQIGHKFRPIWPTL